MSRGAFVFLGRQRSTPGPSKRLRPDVAMALSSSVAIRHCPGMPSLTDTLCTRCGLCCDGSLLADVELRRAEATGLEILGLEIEDDDAGGALLLLPCGALRGRRCSIYAHRPQCCRTFECRLLQEVRRGMVSVDRAGEHIAAALKAIGRVKGLLARLGQGDELLPLKERCAEALAVESDGNQETNRTRADLEAAMSVVERMVQQTF